MANATELIENIANRVYSNRIRWRYAVEGMWSFEQAPGDIIVNPARKAEAEPQEARMNDKARRSDWLWFVATLIEARIAHMFRGPKCLQ